MSLFPPLCHEAGCPMSRVFCETWGFSLSLHFTQTEPRRMSAARSPFQPLAECAFAAVIPR